MSYPETWELEDFLAKFEAAAAWRNAYRRRARVITWLLLATNALAVALFWVCGEWPPTWLQLVLAFSGGTCARDLLSAKLEATTETIAALERRIMLDVARLGR